MRSIFLSWGEGVFRFLHHISHPIVVKKERYYMQVLCLIFFSLLFFFFFFCLYCLFVTHGFYFSPVFSTFYDILCKVMFWSVKYSLGERKVKGNDRLWVIALSLNVQFQGFLFCDLSKG